MDLASSCHWRKCLSLTHQPLTSNNSLEKGRVPRVPPCSVTSQNLRTFCSDNCSCYSFFFSFFFQPLWVQEYKCCVVPRISIPQHTPPFFWLLHSFCSSCVYSWTSNSYVVSVLGSVLSLVATAKRGLSEQSWQALAQPIFFFFFLILLHQVKWEASSPLSLPQSFHIPFIYLFSHTFQTLYIWYKLGTMVFEYIPSKQEAEAVESQLDASLGNGLRRCFSFFFL